MNPMPTVPGAGTYLGFDVGGRRLGVAVGESVAGTARALTVLPCDRGTPDWERLRALIAEWRPAALVVGVPRHADGTDSDSTALAERLARRLEDRFGLPVHRIDERLSSREAAARLAAAGRPVRGRRDRGRLDPVAAQVILETWLAEQA